MSVIQSVEVIRDANGFWTHPDLPDWGEYISDSVLKEWESENRLVTHFVFMDGDAEQELNDDWFVGGTTDCSSWIPTPPYERSFLLSIHDTEEGPVAMFGTSLDQPDEPPKKVEEVLELLRTAIQEAEAFDLVRTENGQVITGATFEDGGFVLTEN